MKSMIILIACFYLSLNTSTGEVSNPQPAKIANLPEVTKTNNWSFDFTEGVRFEDADYIEKYGEANLDSILDAVKKYNSQEIDKKDLMLVISQASKGIDYSLKNSQPANDKVKNNSTNVSSKPIDNISLPKISPTNTSKVNDTPLKNVSADVVAKPDVPKIVNNNSTDSSTASIGAEIVALMYSEEEIGHGNLSCNTTWDLGKGTPAGAYAYCDNLIPKCKLPSVKVLQDSERMDATTRALGPRGGMKVNYFTTCVLPDSPNPTQYVATIFSNNFGNVDTSIRNDCKTAADSAAKSAGYFDLGLESGGVAYSSCANNQPTCGNGSLLLPMSMTLNIAKIGENIVVPVKQSFACILSGSGRIHASKIVATIYSNTSKEGVNTCLTASDASAKKAGYWDLNNYSYCDAQNIPQCKNGSKKLLQSATSQGAETKYSTSCILPKVEKSEATKIVATIYSKYDYQTKKDTCLTAQDLAPDKKTTMSQEFGYFDFGDEKNGYFGACVNGIPECRNGSNKVLKSSRIVGTSYVYSSECVL